ncbi:MAG: alanine dehydrogenase [Chitinophagales bacterium]|nr:alanine dehydrogenase [Chitinophagales bacterium]
MESILEKVKQGYDLFPKEVLAEISKDNQHNTIGIPNEQNFNDNRIALSPNSVAALIHFGYKIKVEQGAGQNNFSDEEYINAGAMIESDKEIVYQSDILLKVAPIQEVELPMLHKNQVVFSPIYLPKLNKITLKTLSEKKVNTIAYEYIQCNYGTYPIMRSMSEIAGNYALYIATKYLSNEHGKGILLGGIAGQPPTRVLIIGAGTVGEHAAKTAIAMGASVQVFDDDIYRLSRLENDLSLKIYTSVLDPINLAKNMARADVVIGALRPINGKTPVVVTKHMIHSMKKNSVFIDISIDHGGCSETSKATNHQEPTYLVNEIIHYCVPNVASNVSKTASYSLSNILTPILKEMYSSGGFELMLKHNEHFRNGVYIYKGNITKEFIAKSYDLKFFNLSLLLSADF